MKGFPGWWFAEGLRFKDKTPISVRYDGNEIRSLRTEAHGGISRHSHRMEQISNKDDLNTHLSALKFTSQ